MEGFLACTKCHQKSAIDSNYPRCRSCNEPLEVNYINLKKAKIGEGMSSFERYQDFLPFDNVNREISLGEENTPLVKSLVAINTLGINSLY